MASTAAAMTSGRGGSQLIQSGGTPARVSNDSERSRLGLTGLVPAPLSLKPCDEVSNVSAVTFSNLSCVMRMPHEPEKNLLFLWTASGLRGKHHRPTAPPRTVVVT